MVYNPVYKIVPGSAGNFLCPPGHPNHTQQLEGYESPRHRTVMCSPPLDSALADDFDGSEDIKDQVRKIMDAATLVPSELWIRSVYSYFRNSYAPEDMDRNVSRSLTHNPAEIVVNATRKALADTYTNNDLFADNPNYRDGSRRPMRAARRGYEVTATRDGSEVFVYALGDDGTRYGVLHLLEDHAETLTDNGFADVRIEPPQDQDGVFIPERVRATNPVKIDPIDPNRHLAVLCIREYFLDHEPRLDLIADPGRGYGSYPCTKCGERVQYEAKFDKLTKVNTRIKPYGGTEWTYETECPKGDDHTV